MHHLSMHFGISVALVHRIIHKIIPHLHCWAVPKYIRWHSMAHWRQLAGTFPEWPNVVGILDCTPFHISKPKGIVSACKGTLGTGRVYTPVCCDLTLSGGNIL